jgi:Rrf2 family protein
MKISRKAEYGVRAMVLLAKGKSKEAFSVREISNIEKVPFEFLAKIFSSLERAKLVAAKHGANGGYYLAKPAKVITVGSVVEALEGKITPVKCFLCSKAGKCASKDVWDKLRDSLSKTLYSIKLSDLVK